MSNPNGSAPFSWVYEYRAVVDDGKRWIGWSTGDDPPKPHPDSAAAAWLASNETVLDWSLLPAVAFDASTAAKVAGLARRLRREQGFVVMAGRVYNGSGPVLPVKAMLPSGEVRLYRSIRSCGRDLGVSRTVVTRRIMANMPILTIFGVVRVSKV